MIWDMRKVSKEMILAFELGMLNKCFSFVAYFTPNLLSRVRQSLNDSGGDCTPKFCHIDRRNMAITQFRETNSVISICHIDNGAKKIEVLLA